MKTIFYTKFDKENMAAIYDKWLPVLPLSLRILNLKFRYPDDRLRNLLGKILLLQGLEAYGQSKRRLQQIQYNNSGRPYISPDFDFNISHSGNYVFCAAGRNVRLGIDIEKIEPIDFRLVTETMNAGEWHAIHTAVSPLKEYYKRWTIKEAVIKAGGSGLSLPLKDIQIQKNVAISANTMWYLEELLFDPQYCGCIATSDPSAIFKMVYVSFD